MAFAVSVVLLLVAIGGFILGGEVTSRRIPVRTLAGACVALSFIAFGVSGIHSVPTKSIGVPVSLGRVQGQPYGPGAHLTWDPFLHLKVLDETIQTTTFEGCQGVYCQHGDRPGITIPPVGDSGTSTAPCLEVRIGGGQTACQDVTVQWQVRDSGADSLFNDYANTTLLMPQIENAVVIREIRQVLANVLGDYNPIEDTAAITGKGISQYSKFLPVVTKQMNVDIGARIKIDNILMPLLRFDNSTQSRLNSIAQQFGSTAIAQQLIATNQALAHAYGKLAKILASNPNVLISQCLDLISTAEKDNYNGLPLSMGCIPNSSSGLAISAKK